MQKILRISGLVVGALAVWAGFDSMGQEANTCRDALGGLGMIAFGVYCLWFGFTGRQRFRSPE